MALVLSSSLSQTTLATATPSDSPTVSPQHRMSATHTIHTIRVSPPNKHDLLCIPPPLAIHSNLLFCWVALLVSLHSLVVVLWHGCTAWSHCLVPLLDCTSCPTLVAAALIGCSVSCTALTTGLSLLDSMVAMLPAHRLWSLPCCRASTLVAEPQPFWRTPRFLLAAAACSRVAKYRFVTGTRIVELQRLGMSSAWVGAWVGVAGTLRECQ